MCQIWCSKDVRHYNLSLQTTYRQRGKVQRMLFFRNVMLADVNSGTAHVSPWQRSSFNGNTWINTSRPVILWLYNWDLAARLWGEIAQAEDRLRLRIGRGWVGTRHVGIKRRLSLPGYVQWRDSWTFRERLWPIHSSEVDEFSEQRWVYFFWMTRPSQRQ